MDRSFGAPVRITSCLLHQMNGVGISLISLHMKITKSYTSITGYSVHPHSIHSVFTTQMSLPYYSFQLVLGSTLSHAKEIQQKKKRKSKKQRIHVIYDRSEALLAALH